MPEHGLPVASPLSTIYGHPIAPDRMAQAKYSAMRERAVGLGAMGFHSFLQTRGIAFEGALAKSWNLSACIEPIPANIYTHKTLSGSFTVRNPALARLLAAKGIDTPSTWNSILEQALKAITLGNGRIDLAFEMGPLEGLTDADIKRYIRYVADRHSAALTDCGPLTVSRRAKIRSKDQSGPPYGYLTPKIRG